ncbi:glycoside hydrolase family 5 protein [Calocera viscosa TUFC12733]|uniref:mannan endo-1,4-beta-mannosidase n=1 Tax=Calocera viscosa (strain TUFC12733) TaxID=1330018 RepID=A0A167MJ86_CALVF|nr:glycoside hydrolase family 5 protein [Calocera viscosa TUFC12733]
MGCTSSKAVTDDPAPSTKLQPLQHPMAQAAPSPTGKPYITARGSKLFLAEHEFRFASFNLPTLLTSTPYEQEDLLSTLSLGWPNAVARTYTLQLLSKRIGRGEAHVVGWDQAEGKWLWDEDAMRRYDSALALAAKYDVRLIIPIINQDYGGDTNWVGNFTDLCNWVEPGAHWWTSRRMIDVFKQLITDLLSRVNTLTGVAYGSDPTVLAWETGNEMNGGDSSRPAPGAWTVEIGNHIKALAPNTLVMDGSYARTDSQKACFPPEVIAPNSPISILSYHYYGSGDAQRLSKDCAFAARHGKAFVAGEFGFFSESHEFDAFLLVARRAGAAGALVWAMRGHAQDGGFDTHGEGDDIWAYHAPGWTAQEAMEEWDAREVDVIRAVRESAHAFAGMRVPPSPTPQKAPEAWAVKLPPGGPSDWGLTWRGSAWAKYYEVHSDQADRPVVHAAALDCTMKGRMVVPLPEFGRQVWLRIRGMSVEGKPGPFSEAVGIPGW